MKTSQIEMLLYTVELGSIAEAARKLQKKVEPPSVLH